MNLNNRTADELLVDSALALHLRQYCLYKYIIQGSDVIFESNDTHKGLILSKKNYNELSIQVLRKFRVIYGSVRQHFRKIEQTCGVSGSQLWILQEVSTSPGIGVSILAERLSIHQSTCSLLVEKLVIRGLLTKERSLQDQRRVGLYLNEQTKEILAKSPGPAEGILPEALIELPEDVLKVLDESLAEVISRLRLADEKYAEEHLSEI